MANKYLDPKYIEDILLEDFADFADNLNNKVNNLVYLAVEDLSTKVPFISTKTSILQPVNETFNGCLSSTSNFEYFVGFQSPQIEKNCLSNNNWFKKFKETLSTAWRNSKKRKSKRRKLKEELKKKEYTRFEENKYNLESLKKDLQISLVNNLSETSIVYNLPDRLILQGRDDLGSITKIVLYPVLIDGEVFKYFVNRRKGFININIGLRTENFTKKYKKVKDNLLIMLKIMNVLFSEICRTKPNQIFMESLLCGVPDKIYESTDYYEVFIKLINYLRFADVSSIKSIENPTESIFINKLTKNMVPEYLRFMRILTEEY